MTIELPKAPDTLIEITTRQGDSVRIARFLIDGQAGGRMTTEVRHSIHLNDRRVLPTYARSPRADMQLDLSNAILLDLLDPRTRGL